MVVARRRQSIYPGGIARSVAAREQAGPGGRTAVLVAARQDGRLRLYHLGETIRPAAEIKAPGQVKRVRFVGGQLWALSGKGDRVDVYSVDDPDAPVHLGSFTEGAEALFRSVWRGPRAFTHEGPWLKVRQAQVAQP
jgi:hypothetical protein